MVFTWGGFCRLDGIKVVGIASGQSVVGAQMLLLTVTRTTSWTRLSVDSPILGRPGKIGYLWVAAKTYAESGKDLIALSQPLYAQGALLYLPLECPNNDVVISLYVEWNNGGLDWQVIY